MDRRSEQPLQRLGLSVREQIHQYGTERSNLSTIYRWQRGVVSATAEQNAGGAPHAGIGSAVLTTT